MRKLWLVFRREYLVRVRKRSFILATILMPLAFAALAIGLAAITVMSARSEGNILARSERNILVKDDSGIFEASETDRDGFIFTFTDEPLALLRENYIEDGFDLLVHIPPFPDLSRTEHEVTYFAGDQPGITQIKRIEDIIANAFREHKITASNIDRSVYESLQTRISMDSVTEEGSGQSRSGKTAAVLSTILGVVMGVMMYMVILIYGQMVMRSVMEEKISRIAEVMISSVRPFALMMGKILGVGAVGLTQLAIWMILIPSMLALIPLLLPGVDPEAMGVASQGAQAVDQLPLGGFDMEGVITEFFSINWVVIAPTFVLFFLGGYFIYSSVFAAIGSAVDEDLGEAQQFMVPVMIPVIFAFVLMMSTIGNPNSGLSVFGSIFPLFSPIIMPARLPFDPPVWQILLSLACLILTTLLFIWLSARIYRVGILMYGKKVSFRELGRWLFYRG